MDKRSVLYIVCAGISWGTASIFVKELGKFAFSPTEISAIRNIAAAILICICVLIKNPKIMIVPKKEIPLFALSGVCLFLTNAFYYMSMDLTTPSTAVVLMYIAPIFVMAVSVVFMGEKLTGAKAFAVICAFLGCILVTGITGKAKFDAKGILFGILSGISYGSYSVCAKIEMRRKNNPLCATAYCFLTAAALSVLTQLSFTFKEEMFLNPSRVLLLSFGMGIAVGALPYFLYTLASRKLPASTASAMATVEPLTATLISVLFYKERLQIGSFLGILLILGSVLVLSFQKEN